MGKTRLATAVFAAVLALAVPAVAAGGGVPKITHLKASPKKFCVKSTSRCHHPGTHLSFQLSSDARVRGDIRPRNFLVGPTMEFDKKFSAGSHRIYFNDKSLHGGAWVIRLQGMNKVGSGGVATVTVHIRDHD